MPLNDNTLSQIPPYVNDYPHALDSGYHGILFKPSFPVQARELTQLQYILQSQVERVASTLYKNGSIVKGGSSFSLVDVIVNDSTYAATNNTNLDNFVSTDVDGNITGSRKVIDTGSDTTSASPAWNSSLTYPTIGTKVTYNGSTYENIKQVLVPSITPPSTDLVNWKLAIISAQFAVKLVEVNNGQDYVFASNSRTGLKIDGTSKTKLLVNDTFKVDDVSLPTYVGKVVSINNKQAIAIHIDDTTFFYDGYLISSKPSTIVLRTNNSDGSLNFDWNLQTCKVGVIIDKQIVTVNEDETLSDPARGSNNYGAPGADRLQITATLVQLPWDPNSTDTPSGNFIELIRLNNGVVIGQKDPNANGPILDLMASRMYDQSGSFTVDPFALKIDSDISDHTMFEAILEPGDAYHYGYQKQTIASTTLFASKARSTTTFSNAEADCRAGSRLNVTLASPTTQIDFNKHRKVYLQNASNQTIGAAFIKDFVYREYLPTPAVNLYYLYLYDVDVSAGYQFSQVRYINISTDNGTVETNVGVGVRFADIESTTGIAPSGATILFDADLNTLVFPVSSTPMVPGSLKESTFQFNESFTGVIPTVSGTLALSVDTAATDTFYPFVGNDLTSNSEIIEHYIIINEITGAVINSNLTVSSSSTNRWQSVEISVTGGFPLGNTFTVMSTMKRELASGPNRQKTLRLNCMIGNVSSVATERNFRLPIVNNTVQLNVPDVYILRKVSIIKDAAGTAGDDVTSLFVLHNGQTDNRYEYAHLTLDASAFRNKYGSRTITDVFGGSGLNVVRVYADVFEWTHVYNGSPAHGGEFTVDSYNYDLSVASATAAADRAAMPVATPVTSAASTNADYELIKEFNTNISNTSQVPLTPNESQAWFFQYDLDSVPTYVSSDASNSAFLGTAVDFRVRQYVVQDVACNKAFNSTASNVPGTFGTSGRYSQADAAHVTYNDGPVNETLPNDAVWFLTPGVPNALVDVTFESNYTPNAFDTFATWDSTYDVYVPRIDTIVLTKDQQFSVIQGVPGLQPVKPSIPSDSLPLYDLQVPAYTFEPVLENVVGHYYDNQRITMSDLRKFDTRLTRLEQIVSLSLLEQKIKDVPMSDINGDPVLKNGILADNFSSLVLADAQNPYYKASIDSDAKECRPSTKMDNVSLVIDDTHMSFSQVSGKNYKVSNGGVGNNGLALWGNRVLTINPIGEEAFVTQPFASDFINVNPFNVFKWEGTLSLAPSTDNWADTKRKIVLVNQQSIYDLDQNFKSWGQKILGQNDANGDTFNGYDPSTGITWNNVYDKTTTSLTTSFKKTGTRVVGFIKRRSTWGNVTNTPISAPTGITTNTLTTTQKIGGYGTSVDVSLNMYCRARIVELSVSALKPNTQLYVFMDSTNVTSLCTQNSSTILRTDNTGFAKITFNLPAATFYTGVRLIKVIDSPDGKVYDDTTYATASYYAQGVTTTKTGYLIPDYKKVTKQIITSSNSSGSNVITGVNNSVSVSDGIDLSTFANQGIDAQEASVCWMDPIAQSFLVPADQYPNGVVLSSIEVYFKSVDSVIPVTMEIRRSVNGYPNAAGAVPFSTKVLSPSVDSVSVSDDASVSTEFRFDYPVALTPGEYHIVLRSNSDSYHVWTSVVGNYNIKDNVRITNQPYGGVFFKSSNNTTWTPDQTRDLTMKINRFVYNSGPSTTVSCTFLSDIPETTDLMDLMFVKAQYVTHGANSTNISWDYRGTNAVSKAYDQSYIPFQPNQTIVMPTRKVLLQSSEIGNFDGDPDTADGRVSIRSTFITYDGAVSPQIDLEQLSVTAIQNVVNNSVIGENLSIPDQYNGAIARYITKRVDLTSGFECDSLRLDLSANLQGNGRIHIFYKALGVSDSRLFTELPWNEMELDLSQSFQTNVGSDIFSDYTFKPVEVIGSGERLITYNTATDVPTLNGSSGLIKSFAFKVVFTTDEPAKAPRIKNLRGVATL